jgi:two-component system cell cycle response regulator CpdR
MRPQVLVADDEAALRALIAENLLDRNIGVVEAGDGVEALEMLRAEKSVQLLLSDIRMPRMDGHQLVDKAVRLYPDLKVVMMTGYAAELPTGGALHAREIRTLLKPLDIDRLTDLVADMLTRS